MQEGYRGTAGCRIGAKVRIPCSMLFYLIRLSIFCVSSLRLHQVTHPVVVLRTIVKYSWRGSLKSRPPQINLDSYHWPGRDRRYSDLTMDQIPLTESLLDCMERTEVRWVIGSI